MVFSSIKSTDNSTFPEFDNMNIYQDEEDMQASYNNESSDVMGNNINNEENNLDRNIKKSYALALDSLKKCNDLIKKIEKFQKNPKNIANREISPEEEILGEVIQCFNKLRAEKFRIPNYFSIICSEIVDTCSARINNYPEDWKLFFEKLLKRLEESNLIDTLIKLFQDLEKSMPDPRFWSHVEWIVKLISKITDNFYDVTFNKGDFNTTIYYFCRHAEILERPYKLKDLYDIELGLPVFLESEKVTLINFLHLNMRIWCYLNSTYFIFRNDQFLFEKYKSLGDSFDSVD